METELHCYIVSYDLCSPERDYDGLYSELMSFSSWGRLTESTWAIVTSSSYVEIRDRLSKFLDSGDRLIVIKSGKSAAWSNVMASNEWVKDNIVL